MKRDLNNIANKHFDLLIVGGGINGCAIANLAAQAGVRVCIVEKGDFANGTSSRSTKLLHGGIRYLENFEFDLVSEALRERYIQWQSVPYLVKPMPFVIPVYKNDKRPLWMMYIGVWLYDILSGRFRIGQHKLLSVDEVVGLVSGINRQGLVGGVQYYDAQMDDTRIVIENALMADLKGANVANYVEVTDFIKDNGKVKGVKAKDLIANSTFDILADTVIVTAGPWADEVRVKDISNQMPRLRMTKGAHIVYQGQLSTNAFLIQSKQDNRIFFVIPFHGNTLIGTTDTDFKGNPNTVSCDDSDISYLLTEAARVFPNIQFERSKIINTFAGVRPLVVDKGKGIGPSKVSRKHVIEQTFSNVWYVLGGKYTTYRAIAEEAVYQAMPQLKGKLPFSEHYVLYGSGAVNEELKLLRHRYGVTIETIRYLISVYGSRFEDILKITQRDPALKEPICTCSPTIGAQIVYAKEVEMALTPEDIYARRLILQYNNCPTQQCYQRIKNS